jgi:hypothetical protein
VASIEVYDSILAGSRVIPEWRAPKTGRGRHAMDATPLNSPPARGRGSGPVVWDRTSWYAVSGEGAEPEDPAEHIAVMIRWLWAHGLTTPQGDQAARGEFTGALGSEIALTSDMVTEPAAIFLDHYYGQWLTALPDLADAAYDEAAIDALWQDFEGRREDLDRVWGV